MPAHSSCARPSSLLFCATLAFAATQPSTPGPDEAGVRAARQAQNRAIAKAQWDSVASFWVRDVAVVAGLGVTFQGRDAYRAAFRADSGMVYERTPTRIQVSSQWPLAWEEGSWTGRPGFKPSPPLVSGRYSAQWVKVNGRWLIRSELFVALTCTGQACRWQMAQPSS
jgi:ketosteroid isomerase-like protein